MKTNRQTADNGGLASFYEDDPDPEINDAGREYAEPSCGTEQTYPIQESMPFTVNLLKKQVSGPKALH